MKEPAAGVFAARRGHGVRAAQLALASHNTSRADGLTFFADITIGDPGVAVTHAMGMSRSSLNVVYTASGMIAAINSILAGIGIALILCDARLMAAIAG